MIQTRAKQIFKNALSGAGARLAMMIVGFGLTPYIIHSLGLQNYGLYSIVGALAGYLGLLDFGLGGAFVKFITEHVEQNRRDRARQVISFGMLFYAAIGVVLAVPIYFLSPALVHLFKMPAADVPGAIQLFRLIFVFLILSMVLGLPGATVVSMQRMDLASRNNFIGYLLYAAITVVLLRLGFGVWGVVYAQGAQAVITATLQYATARRLFGPIFHNPLRFERAVVGRLFSFGGWTQLTSLLNIASLDAGRFITAGAIGVASVSYYEIASKLSFFSKSLPSYLLDAIMPAASAADAKGDADGVERMYRVGTLYSMLGTLGIAGFLIGAIGPVMRVWLGTEYPFVGAIILWLGVGYAVSGLTGVGTTILRASGLPKYETAYTAVTTVANIIATIALVPSLGIIGVALGTAIGWAAGTLYFLAVYHRLEKTSWMSSVGSSTLRMSAAAIVATLLLTLVSHAPFEHALFANRIVGALALAFGGGVYLAGYVALAWVFGTFRRSDADVARHVAIVSKMLLPNRHREVASTGA